MVFVVINLIRPSAVFRRRSPRLALRTDAGPRMNGLARLWDSDIAWSFRHSPVAQSWPAWWTVGMILAAILAPLYRTLRSFDPGS